MKHSRQSILFALLTVIIILVHSVVPHHHHVNNFAESQSHHHSDNDHSADNEIDENVIFSFILKQSTGIQLSDAIVPDCSTCPEPQALEVFGVFQQQVFQFLLTRYFGKPVTRGPPIMG